jgi:hypothetical protein
MPQAFGSAFKIKIAKLYGSGVLLKGIVQNAWFLLSCVFFLCCMNFMNPLQIEITNDSNISSFSSALPPIHLNSSWIGNHWIPPQGYKTYSPNEVRNYFSKHSVLFVGDSTARRTFATWYALMNATTDHDVTINELDSVKVIDVNKKVKSEPCHKDDAYYLCRQMPGTVNKTHQCNLSQQACLSGLVDLLEPSSYFMRDLSQYSMVVFIIGPWEYGRLCKVTGIGRQKNTEDFIQGLIHLTDTHPNTKFIWRTWAGSGHDHNNIAPDSFLNSQAHNNLVNTLVQDYQREQSKNGKSWTQLSYIDWGQVMGPRLFPGSRRIKGDMHHHFGLEARITFVQMWMNHLVEQERQDRLHLSPWWTLFDGDANDCFRAGGSPPYCATPGQIAEKYESFLTVTKP